MSEIDKIIEDLDPKCIVAVMKSIDWKWRGKTVTEDMFRDQARELCIEALRTKDYIASGGLEAECCNGINLTLKFVLSESKLYL